MFDAAAVGASRPSALLFGSQPGSRLAGSLNGELYDTSHRLRTAQHRALPPSRSTGAGYVIEIATDGVSGIEAFSSLEPRHGARRGDDSEEARLRGLPRAEANAARSQDASHHHDRCVQGAKVPHAGAPHLRLRRGIEKPIAPEQLLEIVGKFLKPGSSGSPQSRPSGAPGNQGWWRRIPATQAARTPGSVTAKAMLAPACACRQRKRKRDQRRTSMPSSGAAAPRLPRPLVASDDNSPRRRRSDRRHPTGHRRSARRRPIRRDPCRTERVARRTASAASTTWNGPRSVPDYPIRPAPISVDPGEALPRRCATPPVHRSGGSDPPLPRTAASDPNPMERRGSSSISTRRGLGRTRNRESNAQTNQRAAAADRAIPIVGSRRSTGTPVRSSPSPPSPGDASAGYRGRIHA